jgi:hypothetical protein
VNCTRDALIKEAGHASASTTTVGDSGDSSGDPDVVAACQSLAGSRLHDRAR